MKNMTKTSGTRKLINNVDQYTTMYREFCKSGDGFRTFLIYISSGINAEAKIVVLQNPETKGLEWFHVFNLMREEMTCLSKLKDLKGEDRLDVSHFAEDARTLKDMAAFILDTEISDDAVPEAKEKEPAYVPKGPPRRILETMKIPTLVSRTVPGAVIKSATLKVIEGDNDFSADPDLKVVLTLSNEEGSIRLVDVAGDAIQNVFMEHAVHVVAKACWEDGDPTGVVGYDIRPSGRWMTNAQLLEQIKRTI